MAWKLKVSGWYLRCMLGASHPQCAILIDAATYNVSSELLFERGNLPDESVENMRDGRNVET